MGKPVSIGQSHNLMSVLAANTDWSALDSDTLQSIIEDPRGAGRRFTTFLQNGGARIPSSNWISIDRLTPFNSAKFFKERGHWHIEETDPRSVELIRLDLSRVALYTFLLLGEIEIAGDQREARMKRRGHIRLDAKVFETLWHNQHHIPELWKQAMGGQHVRIFFNGTVFRSPRGNRTCFYLQWNGCQWTFGYEHWLNDNFRSPDVSAVLE